MNMTEQRRQFERFAISEDAIAYDQNGRRLGRVTVAGGGGMAILLENAGAHYAEGDSLRVTVVEPNDVRHTIDARVCYLHEQSLGLEFITGPIR